MKRHIFPLTLIALFGSVAVAIGGGNAPSVPNAFTAGTPALASQVNENFAALADSIGELPRPNNVLLVATSGTEFNSVGAALASITDATADNRYLVQVAPGVYDELDTVTVPAFVQLKGSGESATVVRSTVAGNGPLVTSSTMLVEDLAAVSDMTVANDSTTLFGIAIYCSVASRDTLIQNVTARATETGGTAHFGLYMNDCDMTLKNVTMLAEGATTVNSGFASVGQNIAEPVLIGCRAEGRGQNSGFGAQMTRTALDAFESDFTGQFRALSGTISGITELHNCRVRNIVALPVLETNGSASFLSASTYFIGADPVGLATSFRYVHCYKANFTAVVNGNGSSVQAF